MAGGVWVLRAGLRGLASGAAPAGRGCRLPLLEARPRLGGRAGSFADPATGQLTDACQHVSMSCCTNFAHLRRRLGIDRLLRPQRRLYFLSPDRRLSRFAADPLPAPFHLLRAFASLHHLTLADKLRIA